MIVSVLLVMWIHYKYAVDTLFDTLVYN